MNAIRFSLKGHAHDYEIPGDTPDGSYIKLPSGQIYQLVGWLESNPPQPQLQEDHKLVYRANAIKAKSVK